MSQNLTKHELRHVMRKIDLGEEKITEIESKFPGKDNLAARVVEAMQEWKGQQGVKATADVIIKMLHVVNMDTLSENVKAMKMYSQAIRI